MNNKISLILLAILGTSAVLHAQVQNNVYVKHDSGLVKRPVPLQLQQAYYNKLGLVCKWEYQFEKQTKLPLRLRLGSLSYTDHMEQKDRSPQH